VKKICITGQNGFIGKHLYNTLRLFPKKYLVQNFEDKFFENFEQLKKCVKSCDVIIHLAALNRDPDKNKIFKTNILLVEKLIKALIETDSIPQIIMSSSTQESENNQYGKSKKIGREKFIQWSNKYNANFVGMLIPNVFGPFGLPNYNSFIATFCHKLVNNEKTKINEDKNVGLIYIDELIREIMKLIDNNENHELLNIKARNSLKVSVLLKKLIYYKNTYLINNEIPKLSTNFDLSLFNTFRSYINYKSFFPKQSIVHSDIRGNFSELIRLGCGGQVSFSTTKKGVVRGNHFHTRKIERFSVIKGIALIKMRKIGTSDILEFIIDGDNPAYVDMPIWYTHNIKNIGKEDLYTVFWINEPYNENDSDTFVENV
jgi:UDP-2-acetamido-2,6-beta-L-arabino-hexul-4-ose reductase